MGKEYIEREAAIEQIRLVYCKECNSYNGVRCRACEFDDAMLLIEDVPTADVVKVVHGEWKIKSEIHQMFDDVDEELYVECPYCQRTFWIPYEFEDEKIIMYAREHYPYCHCGAKMDGERKEV